MSQAQSELAKQRDGYHQRRRSSLGSIGEGASLVGAPVQLRNERLVFRSGDTFHIEQRGKRGETYGTSVPHHALENCYRAFSGQTLTAQDAADQIGSAVKRLGIPFTHGHKLQFYAQDVLIVLVALGRASHEKVGRTFVYKVGTRNSQS